MEEHPAPGHDGDTARPKLATMQLGLQPMDYGLGRREKTRKCHERSSLRIGEVAR